MPKRQGAFSEAIHEQELPRADPDVAQKVGEFDVAPGQSGYGVMTPEMPASHIAIDPANITIEGLRKCDHFARVAEENPELAIIQAKEIAHFKKQEAVMRQEGMNDKAIKSQKMAALRERHQEKVKAQKKPGSEKATLETKSEAVQQSVVEQENQITVTARAASGTTKTVADSEPVTVTPGEVFDKRNTQYMEASVTTAQTLVKETVAAVHEPSATHVAMKQTADHATHAAQAAQLDIERTYAATTETSSSSYSDEPVFIPESVAIAHERDRHYEQPEIVLAESIATSDYELLLNHKAITEAVRSTLIDELWHDESPEYLLFDGSIDSAEALAAEELILSPVAVSNLEYGEVVEQLDIAPVMRSVLPEVYTLTESQGRVTWADELDKEPVEVYEDFTEALQLLAELSALPVALERDESQDHAEITDEYAKVNIEALEPRPVLPIVQTVAERLIELEPAEKEAVLPIVQDIVVVVAALQQLSINESAPEITAAAEARCEELIITLFETLGIEYAEEDIKAFMSIILRSDFQPAVQAEEASVIEVDLEHDGTREAKWHFPQLTSSLATARQQLQQTLGTFVLFCTSAALKRQAASTL